MFALKPTDVAAWYAAALATTVFLWDVYKWRMGSARLFVAVAANTVQVSDRLTMSSPDRPSDGDVFVSVDIQNRGSKRTTVTNLGLFHFSNLFYRVLRKPTTRFFGDPLLGKIPDELDVGKRWFGLLRQTETIERLARSGYLYVVISHAGSSKPVLARVRVAKSAIRV